MDDSVRNAVRQRADNECEYCRLRQDATPFARFHVEHVVPRKHGGGDDLENLALACYHCNLHKGTNLTGIDPETGEITIMFRPRTERWQDHFVLQGVEIVGVTATGRTTVRVLDMNAPDRQQLRAELKLLGRFP